MKNDIDWLLYLFVQSELGLFSNKLSVNTLVFVPDLGELSTMDNITYIILYEAVGNIVRCVQIAKDIMIYH